MRYQLVQTTAYSWLLSVIIPGLGHMLWGDYLFGLFVMLIMIMGLGLTYVGLFIGATSAWFWGLLSLPVIFYLISMVDLKRSSTKRKADFQPSAKRGLGFALVGLAFQLFVPGSPGNFLVENRPAIYRMKTADLEPVISKGELVKACSTDYYLHLFFYERPAYHKLPERFDLVAFEEGDQSLLSGVVIGLPGEEVVRSAEALVVNGAPIMTTGPIPMTGDCPLTTVGPYSILVAELHLGRIASVHELMLDDLVGKISPLL